MISRFPIPLFVLLSLLSLGACGSGKTEENRNALATVNDIALYDDEVKSLVPAGLGREDSLLFVRNYVQNWVEEQLLVQEASGDSKVNLDLINERVEEYRRSLIYYEHVANLISSSMDTNVTDVQLKDFYDNNKDNFELRDNILKAKYIIAPSTAKKVDKVKKRFFSGEETDELLQNFCRDEAYRCQLDDTSWISYEDLVKVIPIDRTVSPELVLKKKTMEISDTGLVYWVKISDYKIKEGVSPFEFVRDEIKLILLNRRKKEFLAAYRKKLFDEALENKKVELNNP